MPTTAVPRAQPSTNAGPFTRPRGVPRKSTEAMIGNGLIATPTAAGSIWPIALAHGPGLYSAVRRRGRSLERHHRDPGGDPGQDRRRDGVRAGRADEDRRR